MIYGDVWVVITTIYPPKQEIKDFLELGWKVVVVADKKTPADRWSSFVKDGLFFFSLDEQEERYPVLSKLIGWNTYARKNLGYLYAIENNAEIIFDTDDDTFIRNSATELVSGIRKFQHFKIKGNGWFNPYILFAPNSGLWPRGYPIAQVAKDRWLLNQNLKMENSEEHTPDILQTLVNLEPDIDAIYRMTQSDDILEFPISDHIYHVGWPVITSGNTQSTFWFNRSSFCYLYIPTTVSFRFTDILKMFIAQSQVGISYSGFLTYQIRNPHDYMKDFASKIQCYMRTPEVAKLLLNKNFASLVDIYNSLTELNICDSREIEIVEQFSLAMSN